MSLWILVVGKQWLRVMEFRTCWPLGLPIGRLATNNTGRLNIDIGILRTVIVHHVKCQVKCQMSMYVSPSLAYVQCQVKVKCTCISNYSLYQIHVHVNIKCSSKLFRRPQAQQSTAFGPRRVPICEASAPARLRLTLRPIPMACLPFQ